MTNYPQKFLLAQQILTMRRKLPIALDYHFNNFLKLQELASLELDHELVQEDRLPTINAMANIMFEVQAYISQARRLRYFLKNMIIKELLTEPHNKDLKKIWDYFMDDNGTVNLLGNKWAAHRSYDDPKGNDNDSLHAEVLLNLDGAGTFWKSEPKQLIVYLGDIELNLNKQHSEIKYFITWAFSQPKLKEIIEQPLRYDD